MNDSIGEEDAFFAPQFFAGGFSVPEEDWDHQDEDEEAVFIYQDRKGARFRNGLTLRERQRISREIEEADTAYDPIADGPIRV